jgi:MFS family permease
VIGAPAPPSVNVLEALDRNGRLVIAGRAVRAFAFGLNSVALGLYLAALELPGDQVGAILSAALVGSVLLTSVIALRGDRLGRRRLLVAGGALMLLAAVIPLVGANPLLLAILGLTGMIAVNSLDSTGLQTIDQALLPSTVPDRLRTAAFAAYGVAGAIAAALGALAVGPLVAVGEAAGLSGPDRFAPAFVVYAAAGVVALVLGLGLDGRAEVPRTELPLVPLARSRGVVARLSLLFALDSFASGFVVQSFLALWFALRFGLEPAMVGLILSVGQLLSAASYPAAAWLAGRIGLVRTMVFTHIPASVLLGAMAFAPAASIAGGLYLLRAFLAQMDVPARQSYLMAIVPVEERTATAGITNLAKSVATSVGPAVAGALLVPLGLGAPLVACGTLKIAYDLALYSMFQSRPAPEEAVARWAR